MNGALKQQINGNDKWCLTPITPCQSKLTTVITAAGTAFLLYRMLCGGPY